MSSSGLVMTSGVHQTFADPQTLQVEMQGFTGVGVPAQPGFSGDNGSASPTNGDDSSDEVAKLKEELARLQSLLGSANSGKENPALVVDFHDSADDDREDPWWDIFSLVNRFTPSQSPNHKDLLEKYQGYGPLCSLLVCIDHFFEVTSRKTSFFTEAYGGVTIFFSMAYILALNPILVSGAIGAQYKPGLFFSTCLASGIFCCFMGLLVNIPVALAPGMGLNGYFANVARVDNGVLIGTLTWQQAMGAVFMSGVFYLILTISGLRFILFKAVPMDLRRSISAGIGLFITCIGYKLGNILGISYYGGPMDGTPHIIPFASYDIVQIPLTGSPVARVSVLGLMWVSFFLLFGVRAGILCAIVLTTFCGISGDGTGSDSVTSLSVWHQDPIPFVVDTSHLLAGKLDFSAAGQTHFWDVTWTFIFVEMFDSFGTLSTIMIKSGIGAGNVKKADRAINNAMLIDGWGLLFGSLIGSNSITTFVESLTGIAAGARTGLAALACGVLFLLSMAFVFPFVDIIPNSATLPALFMVGVYSISEAVHVDWDDFPTAFSCFMIIITMPLTYSIANGIAAGFIFYNWCVTVRWAKFRLDALLRRAPVLPGAGAAFYKGPSDQPVWESGWNPAEPKDFLAHPVMYAIGVFMVLRYRYFF